MKNKISIIIPFYNTKIEYLKKSIESAINQTYNNIEIILINDGSLPIYDSFLESYDIDKAKATNSEFIVTIADKLRLEYRKSKVH